MNTMIKCKTSSACFGLSGKDARTRRQCKLIKVTSCACGAKGNYYKVLSLESENVGAEDIKKAYRRLALRYHPDVCPPSRKPESTAMFLELQRAYETLSNPVLKVKYDTELRLGAGEMSVRRSTEFGRDVWEAQLCMLRVRSDRREKARKDFRMTPC